MNANQVSTYSDVIKDLMGKKSYLLSKAEAFFEIGLLETAQPLFHSAAMHEERIAALLDTEGRELEAAVHRISAASCYAKAAHFSPAINLYRAALAGPLPEHTRAEVVLFLNKCLRQLAQNTSQGIPFSTSEPAIVM